MPQIKSTFAILDVKGGRDALRKRIQAGEKVRVTIEAVITDVLGADDGVSIEFGLEVLSLAEA